MFLAQKFITYLCSSCCCCSCSSCCCCCCCWGDALQKKPTVRWPVVSNIDQILKQVRMYYRSGTSVRCCM